MMNDKGKQGRIIIPVFSDLHGSLLQCALRAIDQEIVILTDRNAETVRKGLAAVNNDACYEAFSVVGQVLSVEDLCEDDIVAVPQICVKCRAIDLPFFIHKALSERGLGSISVLEAHELLLERAQDVMTIPGKVQRRCGCAIMLGDVLMQARCAIALYTPDVDERMARWKQEAEGILEMNESDAVIAFARAMSAQVSELVPHDSYEPLIGVVGSAPVVFDENMNANLIHNVEREQCRVMLPYLSDYVFYRLDENDVVCSLGNEIALLTTKLQAAKLSFATPLNRDVLHDQNADTVPEELIYGAGWTTAARMAYLIEQGISSIIYAGIFGCLSGHVLGKGVVKWARSLAPDVSIGAIEFDPGTSEVNQINRIKLLASLARHRQKGGSS